MALFAPEPDRSGDILLKALRNEMRASLQKHFEEEARKVVDRSVNDAMAAFEPRIKAYWERMDAKVVVEVFLDGKQQ